ncbi:hypothetical protein fugu_006271 [Takifugu bimaculatus]|uniref:BZIP domain-containing protein n=1 Tax=Takifugu bimaculatus TaxID=433685 RepID=A0A4Z2BAJ2_9TELE|nr:hypothetical protein fugu_006271 [Takifugu bimaculatus]
MDSETGIIAIDQGGEWDLSLFDELDNLGDADDLLVALEKGSYESDYLDLDFDINIPPWNAVDTSSTSTDGEVRVDSVSPAHTLSSVPSPCSLEALSPYSLQDEAFSPQSQLSPVSVCSDSSGFSVNSTTAKKPPKKPSQTTRGRPIVLSQPGQVLQIPAPQAVTGNIVTMPTLKQNIPVPVAAPPVVNLCSPLTDDESKVSQRQQRMIKNRESASLSRKKKKEYLLSLETRLKMALSENEVLKCENGNLKRQLEGLLNENVAMNAKVPKRRAVCLMVVLVFLVINVGPMSVCFRAAPSNEVFPTQHRGRHLLDFASETETEAAMGPDPLSSGPSEIGDSSEDKALVVVKDPIFLRPPPPCQPPVNRTKCLELAHELRGWVQRYEVQQTKSRRMGNGNHKPTGTILKTVSKDAENAQIVTVQYTDAEKNPGSELQVYYAPHRTYSDFFDEINRRSDTFYVVSFRRVRSSLLPATSHIKGSRPKMSVVLPAMNINDSIIQDKDYEVMMQIDCEVTDTRILHVRSSAIPPLLRVNHTDTVYQHSPTTETTAAPPVGGVNGISLRPSEASLFNAPHHYDRDSQL